MELIVSRLNHHYQGLKLVFKENDILKTLGIINGNDPEFAGPIILLNIDQHSTYGLSHPEIISRILEKGPQYLLTTKEIGHNLFEHGMKAALGKIKIQNNYFNTALDTFYSLITKTNHLSLVVGKDNQIACVIQPRLDLLPVLISNTAFYVKETENEAFRNEISLFDKIELESIRTHVILKMKLNSTYGHCTPKQP